MTLASATVYHCIEGFLVLWGLALAWIVWRHHLIMTALKPPKERKRRKSSVCGGFWL